MGDEFYCTLKLNNGEEIFSLICVDENNGDPLILLQHPVIINFIINNGSSYIKIKPWINISDDDIQIIKFEKVITMTEIKNSLLIESYEKYVQNKEISEVSGEYYKKQNGEVKLSCNMGYVTSVKEARELLENLYKHF